MQLTFQSPDRNVIINSLVDFGLWYYICEFAIGLCKTLRAGDAIHSCCGGSGLGSRLRVCKV